MSSPASLIDYYARRASEYERIYAKPERQNDLAKLRETLRKTFAGRDVLEVACGTGYWTQVISQTAKSILATDINEEVLQIARAKKYGCGVEFQQADAFEPRFSPNGFSAGLAAFWWSHLRKSEITSFLSRFHRQLPSGGLVIFVDNKFVPGSSTPIARTDDEGNGYQIRQLDDGSRHEVLKNFPTEAEMREVVGGVADNLSWKEWQYYWLFTYTLK